MREKHVLFKTRRASKFIQHTELGMVGNGKLKHHSSGKINID